MAKQADTKKIKVEGAPPKPLMQELTQAQAISALTGIASLIGGNLLGITPAGRYRVYRKMRSCPTVALARIAATAPILLANCAFTAHDDVPDEHRKFIQEQIEPLYPRLIKDMLFGLDYGWQPFEKVWTVRDGRLVYDKLKPLIVDKTNIQVDKKTGSFRGLKQANAVLPETNAFVYTYDAEGSDLHGRSRHENIRENAWFPWTEVLTKMRTYAAKVAGVVPMIEYPPGFSKDADGSDQSNFKLSKVLLEALGKAKGVTMPNTLAAHATDLMRAGVDLDQLKAWRISFLETKPGHGREYSITLRYLDSLMLRGWLVPERAATEGQFGTKAEASTHAELALVMADLVYQEMLRQLSDYVINPLLVYNFGLEAKDSIWLTRAGLDPAIVSFLRGMIEKVLTAPINTDLFMAMIDVDTVLDQIGLPKAAEVVAPDAEKLKGRHDKQKEGKENTELSMTRGMVRMYSLLRRELNGGNGNPTRSSRSRGAASRF